MLELQPLQAIRYNFDALRRDISDVLAPPYDVLNDADKHALLARSDRNIVAIDLPHVPPKSEGPAAVYQSASETLCRWLDDGTLVRESSPAIYAYHQAFQHEGRSLVRRMFIARLRLEPFERGVILPHEQTFGGPKEDRLALMKATACQLSPIFGLYTDSADRVGGAFAPFVSKEPDAEGTCSGVENRLWIVTNRASIDLVASTLREQRVYIADGHHRYGTALMYRAWCAEQNGGSLPTDHPANFVMFVLASMDDPGCLILPYCRVLGDVSLSSLLDAWREGVEVVAGDSAAGDASKTDLTVQEGANGRRVALRFTRREVLRTIEPDQVEPWYALDCAYLHRYLIDELLTKHLSDKPSVYYAKSVDAAISTAEKHNGTALLTNATPMAHFRAMSEAGGLMPQKSTYFHPKLATGLAINPLG